MNYKPLAMTTRKFIKFFEVDDLPYVVMERRFVTIKGLDPSSVSVTSVDQEGIVVKEYEMAKNNVMGEIANEDEFGFSDGGESLVFPDDYDERIHAFVVTGKCITLEPWDVVTPDTGKVSPRIGHASHLFNEIKNLISEAGELVQQYEEQFSLE